MKTSSVLGHVHAIDLIRALTILGVISVHSVFFVNSPNSETAGGVITLLHYTREAFLFITGFVLVYSFRGKGRKVVPFWKKRFTLVGIPYLIWSAVYVRLGQPFPTVTSYLDHLGHALLTGTAWFHLYYLMVTMQIYLIFPLLAWFLRKTVRWHLFIWGLSFLAEVGLLYVYQYHIPTHGLLGRLAAHRDALSITYEFYLLSGSLLAFHFSELKEWLWKQRFAVYRFFALTGAMAVAWYAIKVIHFHDSVIVASAVLQPVMIPYCLAIVLSLFLLGMGWERTRSNRTRDRLIEAVSDHSFGIYLIHPIFLLILMNTIIPKLHALPTVITTPALILVTFGLSLFSVYLLSWMPFSRFVLGRNAKSPIQWAAWAKFWPVLRWRPKFF